MKRSSIFKNDTLILYFSCLKTKILLGIRLTIESFITTCVWLSAGTKQCFTNNCQCIKDRTDFKSNLVSIIKNQFLVCIFSYSGENQKRFSSNSLIQLHTDDTCWMQGMELYLGFNICKYVTQILSKESLFVAIMVELFFLRKIPEMFNTSKLNMKRNCEKYIFQERWINSISVTNKMMPESR